MTWACRHPVAVVSLFTILVLGGLLSWPLLPVELLPNISYPRLIVRTTFGSAAPEEVETLITRPVESSLGTVVGLRSMNSVSVEGISSVTLKFDWGANMSLAAAEVREKLDLITEALPRDVKPPLVMHYDPSDDPIVTLALFGSADPAVMRVWAENTVKTEIETLPGVATVRLAGGHVSEIQVLVDAGRLSAHGIDLAQVANALETANINFPGGKIVRGPLEIPVRTVGRFTDLSQIRDLPIGHGEMRGTVRIRDVAEVTEAPADRTGISRFKGRPALLISIIKEPAANIVEVSRRVRERVQLIRKTLPAGTDLEVAEDQGPFIEEALRDLRDDVLWGSLLAVGVLLVGLRNGRGAALIAVSLPVSVVSTLGFMAIAGVTINFMSIGGLAIGAGMLVDASIVVLEAVHRHSLRTPDLIQAVDAGVQEVNASVISGTVTTVVAVVPILFMTGLAQRLFRDFAFTLSCSLMISLLTALVLLPALVVLTRSRGRQKGSAKSSLSQRMYGALVAWALRHRVMVIVFSLMALCIGAWKLEQLGFQLLPDLVTNQFTMRLTLPPESSIDTVERAVEAAEAQLKEFPEIASFVTEAGVDPALDRGGGQTVGKLNEAAIGIRLHSVGIYGELRERLITTLRQLSSQIPEAKTDFLLGTSFLSKALGGGESPELVRLVGDDLETLSKLGARLVDQLKEAKGLKDIGSQGNVWTDQIQVAVDRYKAAARGISVDEVAQTVQTAVKGKTVGKFIRGDRETDIRVRLRAEDRGNVEDITNLPVSAGKRQSEAKSRQRRDERERETLQEVVVLGQVAELTNGRGPREILRSERRRNVTVTGNVVGAAFSKGEEEASQIAASMKLPDGYRAQAGSERFELMSSMSSLAMALAVALMLTYATMAIQFESVRWPFVILLTAPMTITGPALVLSLANIPINALVLIGFVVLVGVVVDNAILMVAYINQLANEGLPRTQAIIEGCKVRLSPVLMSTGTTVLGILPLCLGWGSGAPLRKALALTVAAGLTASLAFTLVLVPVLYDLAARRSPRASLGD